MNKFAPRYPANHVQRFKQRVWMFVVVALLAAGAYAVWRYAVPRTHLIPTSQKIVTGQVLVRAYNLVVFDINVTPDMVQPNLVVSGLAGNDVVVVSVIAAQGDRDLAGRYYEKFLWQTSGPKTPENFSVPLAQGVNNFVLSNPVLTDRQVTLDATLHYQRSEPNNIKQAPSVPSPARPRMQ